MHNNSAEVRAGIQIELIMAQIEKRVNSRKVDNLSNTFVSSIVGKCKVLASTKDHAHRIYLGQGVYGEGTLRYQRGRFRPWPWTYPDYGSDEYCALFYDIRERYKKQLRSQ